MSWQETYQQWQQQPNLLPSLRRELDQMDGDDEALEEAFSEPMEFGTAGMRGVMGPGIHDMNVYTVRQATEGLARFMDTLDDTTKQRGVAISFDSRYHSREFAHQAALVLGEHHIPSFVFDDIRPTPELSFTVRQLHTYAGIMITASHNPKQYNGYKIYGPDGGQMPPKESDLITKYVRSVTDLFSIKAADIHDMRDKGIISIIGEDVDEKYLADVKTVTINQKLVDQVGSTMTLVYSPLHGTGKIIGRRALSNAGFHNFRMVPQQAIADPEFPTTPFPNPEFAQTFDLAIELGKKIDADLLVATDPDADRLGAAVRQPDGEYALLTGNQIASLLLNYILEAHKQAGTLPANGAIVKSIVSTELATKIAASYNIETINVLTGFKFIAEQIKNFEENKKHTFLFGFEESYGYLIKPFVRDKDAIQSTVLLAEVAAYYKEQGKTLYDGIQELYKKYGYFAEKTTSMEFDGVDGPEQMAQLMDKFRQDTPKEFAGDKVVVLEDFEKQTETNDKGETKSTGLPVSNVLKYLLADGSWICVRPSGTEPKVKFYVGTNGETEDEANQKLDQFEAALTHFIQES